MSDVIPWPYRSRPRIMRARVPVNKMAAMTQLWGADRPIAHQQRGELAERAEAATMVLDRLAEYCAALGQIGAAAGYRELSAQADVLAKQIEAPALEVEE